MPIISGSVLFNVTNTAPTTGTGISNIPVVLRSTTTGNGLVVLTDISGNYSFNNVPNDTYTLVEAFGTTGGVPTPGNFSSATAISAPIPKDPPITSMPSPPAIANQTQSLSPNTLNLNVTADLTGQNFIDAPVRDINISILDTTTSGPNLITAADNGVWGILPAGSLVNSSPLTAPYPTVVPGFTYVKTSPNAPNDGSYSVTNITTLTIFTVWFNFADHTSRDETGRFQIVNGANPNAIVFRQAVNVTPMMNYLLTFWISNVANVTLSVTPAVGVRLIDSLGATVFDQVLSNLPFTSIPTWNQQGTLLTVGNNTALTLEIYSNGISGNGNDYAIDDIFIQLANVATILTETKTVDKAYATLGDTLNYTVALKNVGQSTATNIVFADTIPTGTTFNSGTVRVNGTPFPTFNPTPPGFTLTAPTQLSSGQVVTITFSTVINTIPSENAIINSATASYRFVPVTGGSTIFQNILSNNAVTTINTAALTTSKSRDLAFVTLGDIITYTIPIGNIGNTIARNVIFIDTIPNGTTLIGNSLTINGIVFPTSTPNPPGGLNLGNIINGTITTVSFKVLVTTVPNPNPISNSGNVRYNYISDPITPIINSVSTNTNIVLSQFNAAILTESKIVNRNYANVGDVLTYTIPITNSGNVTATNIVFIDTIPSGTTLVTGSLKQDGSSITGSSNPPGVTLPNGIKPFSISTVTFKVTVNTIPVPNPILNNASSTYQYTVDPTTTPNRIVNSSTNTNTVSTQVNNANLANIVKYTDKSYANCGDTINYTIVIPNTGNVTAQNVVFKDTIPNGTILVPTSIFVNGVPQSGANIGTGITIPNIVPGTTTTLTFSVQVQC